MKKYFLIIFVLLLISCGEKKEETNTPKQKEEVDLIKLKNEKKKEIDSLKNIVKQLQQKKDSLKKSVGK